MPTRLARQLLFAGASLIALTAGAEAAVFNLNRTIGAGSVVGTVTTDGTLGVLAQVHITDWSLALNDGSNTFMLLGPVSGDNSELLLVGSALSATATQLVFDFGMEGKALFQNPIIASGINYYCFEGPASFCTIFGIDNGAAETVALSGELGVTRQGSVVIGTADPIGVPAPAALALFGVGLLGFAVARRGA